MNMADNLPIVIIINGGLTWGLMWTPAQQKKIEEEVRKCVKDMAAEIDNGGSLRTTNPPARIQNHACQELPRPENDNGLMRLLDTDVVRLNVFVRAHNCFRRAGIRYIGELVQKTEQDLMKIHNFGRRSLKETRDALSELGLSLGQQESRWTPPMSILDR